MLQQLSWLTRRLMHAYELLKRNSDIVLTGSLCLCAEHVLQLACMVFKAEAAAVTLMGKVRPSDGAHECKIAIAATVSQLAARSISLIAQHMCDQSDPLISNGLSRLVQDRYYVSGGIGGCVKQIGQDVPWLSAMCGYTLTPQYHEVLVIEDMLEDARCASHVVLALKCLVSTPWCQSWRHVLPVRNSMCRGSQGGAAEAVRQLWATCDDHRFLMRHTWQVQQGWPRAVALRALLLRLPTGDNQRLPCGDVVPGRRHPAQDERSRGAHATA